MARTIVAPTLAVGAGGLGTLPQTRKDGQRRKTSFLRFPKGIYSAIPAARRAQALLARLRLAAIAIPDAPALQIVGREFHENPVAGQDADKVLPQLASHMGQNRLLLVTDGYLDAEHGVW